MFTGALRNLPKYSKNRTFFGTSIQFPISKTGTIKAEKVRSRKLSRVINLADFKSIETVSKDHPLNYYENAKDNEESAIKLIQFAAYSHHLGDRNALINLVECLNSHSVCLKTSNYRPLYFAVDLSLKLNQVKIGNDLGAMLPTFVHIIPVSLRIRLFARNNQINEAFMILEDILNDDSANLDLSTRIAKCSLEELETAISSQSVCDDRINVFQRYRKLLLKYNRCCDVDFNQLLYSPVIVRAAESDLIIEELPPETMAKVLKLAPHILAT